MALSSLLNLGRHTITGALCTSGRQFADWSADYRLFCRDRVLPEALFGAVRRDLVSRLDAAMPLVVGVDDTLLRKRGKKTAGVSWRRDPLGPPFCTNFIRAQRFLQISAALPDPSGGARLIPIDVRPAPNPPKPRKTASAEEWSAYREQQRRANIARKAVDALGELRRRVDEDRDVWAIGDGGYTNGTVLRHLPERTVFVGRIRSDARLFGLPGASGSPRRGRARVYGDAAPTPEQIRRDAAIPWQTVRVFAAGKTHDMRIKTVSPLRWRAAGAVDLRLIVIEPLAYRPRKSSRLLYRSPAYLICTDPEAALEDIVQRYVWRWEIEGNFRDEKTLLGAGQAQVRTEASVKNVPALKIAAYALLLLAGTRTFAPGGCVPRMPQPAWRKNASPTARVTTQDLIRHLRAELWGNALGIGNFADFADNTRRVAKSPNSLPRLDSAVLYAAN